MKLAFSRFSLVSLLGGACGPAITETVEDDSTASSGASSDSGSPTVSTSMSGSTGTGSPTSGDPDATGNPSSGESSDAGSDSTGEPKGFEPVCHDDREWALAISGTNLGRHDGRRLWVSAIEPDENTPHIAVLLEATIAGGEFDLTCPQGLSTNNFYPSIAIVIDADESGSCSASDLAFNWQLFAWMSDQGLAFDGDAVYSLETEPPWLVAEDAWQPISEIGDAWGQPFCDYYFGTP